MEGCHDQKRSKAVEKYGQAWLSNDGAHGRSGYQSDLGRGREKPRSPVLGRVPRFIRRCFRRLFIFAGIGRTIARIQHAEKAFPQSVDLDWIAIFPISRLIILVAEVIAIFSMGIRTCVSIPMKCDKLPRRKQRGI